MTLGSHLRLKPHIKLFVYLVLEKNISWTETWRQAHNIINTALFDTFTTYNSVSTFFKHKSLSLFFSLRFAMVDAESSAKDILLLPVDRVQVVTWRNLRDGSFTEELKRLISFATPMAAVVIAQFSLQIISMVMVGHLGNLALASASLASSFCNVTGFSFIVYACLHL